MKEPKTIVTASINWELRKWLDEFVQAQRDGLEERTSRSSVIESALIDLKNKLERQVETSQTNA